MHLAGSRLVRIAAFLCVAIFMFSFMTVETHQSGVYPWLKYPGFLEADSEIALADGYTVTVEIGGAAGRLFVPGATPVAGRTTLFLNVCRAPPSLA